MPSHGPAPVGPAPVHRHVIDRLHDLYLIDRPVLETRPWVALNMVSSIDGAIADPDGRSGGLSGPADKVAFRLLREWADVVLVGAGTARAENYGPAILDEGARTRRLDAGRPATPTLAVVTARGRLDPDSRLFTAGGRGSEPTVDSDAPTRPLVFTTARNAPGVATTLLDLAEVIGITTEDTGSDPGEGPSGDNGGDVVGGVLATLHRRGVTRVLCEGGPMLNAALFRVDAIDEVCLTLSPVVVGGSGGRVLGAADHRQALAHMALCHVESHDGFVLLRYVRRAA